MWKRLFGLCLLFLLTVAPAGAETFRCRTPDGTLVLTDDPTRLPPNCRAEEPPEHEGTLSVVPAQTPLVRKPESAGQAPAEDGAEEEKTDWRQKAASLVEAYKKALTRRHRTVIAAEKRNMVQRIKKIKEDKAALLAEIESAGLPRKERSEIRQILAEIGS